MEKKLLILGANGYLGARLYFDLRSDFEVVGTYHIHQFHKDFIQLDITDKSLISKIFKDVQPDIVIHTANYPSPRHAKENEDNYRALNLTSTRNIVEVANEYNSKVIFISSFAAINPDNIYGDLKLESEQLVKNTKAGWLVLRPSLILGYSPNTTNDRPFNRVLRCIDDSTQAKFDTSWKFQPTYAGHISSVIKTAIKDDIYNHTIHIFSPSSETQFSTAKDILKPFGVEVKPIDKKMDMPLQEKDENELTDFGLPTCSYEEMINSIHEEIKDKDKFVL